MARNDYECPVCGKVLKIAGPRNIELHEKSKFHVAAMNQDTKNDKVINQAPKSEPINEIKTTKVENENGTNKILKGREHTGEQTNDNGNWDGYLC